MAVTIATIPSPALAGRACKLSLTASAGNFVKVWCTEAPRDSKLRADLDKSGASRVSVVSTGVDSGALVDFTADKGGGYVFLLEEFNKGAEAYGGGYEGDPNAAPEEELLSSASTTVYFASALTCRLGVPPDIAELLVYVSDDQIIPTTDSTHGVRSPLIRNPATPKAKLAADSTDVRAAAAAVIGDAATRLGSIQSEIDDFIDQFNDHLIESGVHDTNDTDNAVDLAFVGASNPEGQRRALSALRDALDHHMRNDNPDATPPGTGSAVYHNAGGLASDLSNLLLNVSPTNDQATLFAALADAARAYTAHLDSAAHNALDAGNNLSVNSLLLTLHIKFNEQLAAYTPATPPNEHAAKAILVNGGGFKEV
jgi:hypothetical protein